MSKKKACFNPECSNYKKTKYKSSETVCSVCQKELDWVCAGKGCFKMIPKTDKYCPICQADINDKKEKAWDTTKKVAGTAFGLALAFGSALIGKEFSKKE